MENNMEDPQRIKNTASILSSSFTSGNTSKGNKNTNSERYLYLHGHSGIIHNGQVTGSFDVWTDKEVVCVCVCVCVMEYYSAVKNQENPTICDTMDELTLKALR